MWSQLTLTFRKHLFKLVAVREREPTSRCMMLFFLFEYSNWIETGYFNGKYSMKSLNKMELIPNPIENVHSPFFHSFQSIKTINLCCKLFKIHRISSRHAMHKAIDSTTESTSLKVSTNQLSPTHT